MTSDGLLSGVRVLDVGQGISGPYCAKIMAQMGAEVIKVEPPEGEEARSMGPFPGGQPHPEKSGLFLALNANKYGITLDLDSADGAEAFRKLAATADIVVENPPPVSLEDRGLGFQALNDGNPGLIFTSITPFGQTGPYSQYKGEEVVNYAMGLIMSISGVQGEEPLKHGGFQAQYEGGLNGAASTSMALFMQSNTGEGQHIDISVTECVASTAMATQTTYPFMGGTLPRRRPSGSNFGHPMPCKDGWIIVQTGGGATWDTIADFFGDPQLKEPKFADPAQRLRNTVELDQVVLDSIKDRGKWDLFTKAAEARMLFGLVQTPSELLECPQLESRNFYREIDHPVIGKVKVPAALFNLSLTPYQYIRPAPTLGQHNSEIYVDGLEYSREDFVRLRQLDVI